MAKIFQEQLDCLIAKVPFSEKFYDIYISMPLI